MQSLLALGGLLRRILAAAVLTAAAALTVGCAPQTPPTVSESVQSYYNENVVSAKPTVATAKPATNTVAFIGDSYSAGAGATKGAGFADLVAKKYSLNVSNFAQGGTGYVKRLAGGGTGACGRDVCPNYGEMAEKVIKNAPAIVIVSGGRNDPADMPAFTAATKALFAELRAGLPKAKIIATSPVWAAADTPAEAPEMVAAVRAAVTGAGGTFVDVGQPFEGRPDLITGDGVHPNSAGHKVLADAVVQGFTAAKVSFG